MTLSFRHRVTLLAVLAFAGVLLVGWRLVQLQAVQHDKWLAEAQARAAGWIPVRAQRGRILDADGKLLAADDATFDLSVRVAAWKAVLFQCSHCGFYRYYKTPDATTGRCPRCKKLRDEKDRPVFRNVDRQSLGPIAAALGISQQDLRDRIAVRVKEVDKAVAKELKDVAPGKLERRKRMAWADHAWRPRTVVRDVSYAAAREVELHPQRNPAFKIRNVSARRHPGGRDFVHILGRTKSDPVNLTTPDGDRALLDMAHGQSGLEYRYDAVLRGHPGWVRIRREGRGSKRVKDGARAPLHGIDIQLTMAVRDQAAAAQALDKAEGALVVVNAETGAVLAMASTPNYEPERHRQTYLKWKDRKNPRGTPLIERACRSFVPPGSIMKPFTAIAALTAGVATPATEVECERLFRRNDGRMLQKALKCNDTHYRLDMRGALVHSCNIYFQTLMREMIDGNHFPHFEEMGRRFGFGQPTGIEIESNWHGKFEFDNSWYRLIASSIGQGHLMMSPAQMARAYAGLYTGHLPRLHVVARVGTTRTAVERERIDVPESVLAPVRAALFQVPVRGTARNHDLARYGLACKTGTAQRAQSGTRLYNSWIAGFAPARGNRPAIAFAIVVMNSRKHSGDECGPRLKEFFQRFYEGAQ